MPAVQETVEQVRRIDVDQYKYGFVTDIESEKAPRAFRKTPSASFRPRRTSRSGCWRGGSTPIKRWLTMREPTWARVDYPQDRLSGHLLLFRAEEEGRRRSRSTRSTPRFSRPTRSSAFRCASRRSCSACSGRRARTARARRRLRPRRGRCGVRFGFGRDHLQGRAGQGRRDLHADLGGDARASRPGEEISRHGGADLATISSPRSTRRCSPTARSSTCRRACAARWSCRPISASTSAIPASSSAR